MSKFMLTAVNEPFLHDMRM